ncbi:uncharacterized protein LOC142181482 [Nicotiana tabacum]|uniref:Uncharacterized protein LOC142181482 n=1 Tax=Nicotiana tabacum TaxID=4097 RepID=A0AC58ULX1_TOBAC
MTLCSRYFEGIESRINRPKRVNNELNHNKASEVSSLFPQQVNLGTKLKEIQEVEGLLQQRQREELIKSFLIDFQNKNARQAELPYYGKLEDIIELNYYGRFMVMLFKCQWADTTRDRGFKIDVWKFNCVNFSRFIHTGDHEDHDSYIEASQANMVYYVDDETDKEWSVIVHLKSRDLFDMGDVVEEEIYKNEPYQQQELEQFFYVNYENIKVAIDEHMSD